MKKKLIHYILVAATLSICKLHSHNDEFIISENNSIIYLIGEDHYDEQSINIKTQLLNAAKNGKIALALEGEFGEMTNFDLFGIEDLHTFVLMHACSYCHGFALHKIINTLHTLNDESWSAVIDVLEKAFINFFSPPLRSLSEMSGMLNFVIDNLAHPICKKNPKIATKLLILHELQSFPTQKQKILNLIHNHSFKTPYFLNIFNNNSAWFNLWKDVALLSYEKSILHKEQITLDQLNQTLIYIEKIQKYMNMDDEELSQVLSHALIDTKNFHVFINNLKFHHRNQVFLKKIISIFENHKSQEKPLYVVIGAAHAPFLYDELVKRGYEVNMNKMAQNLYHEHIAKSEL